MDLKEKLKEILKKNYGITSDAELLEELNNIPLLPGLRWCVECWTRLLP